MLMEAFDGFGHKFHYEIVGHSGESAEVPLVSVSVARGMFWPLLITCM